MGVRQSALNIAIDNILTEQLRTEAARAAASGDETVTARLGQSSLREIVRVGHIPEACSIASKAPVRFADGQARQLAPASSGRSPHIANLEIAGSHERKSVPSGGEDQPMEQLPAARDPEFGEAAGF